MPYAIKLSLILTLCIGLSIFVVHVGSRVIIYLDEWEVDREIKWQFLV